MNFFKALEWYAKGTQAIYSSGETYESLDWHPDNDLPKPTKEQLDTAWKQFDEDFQKREYQRKRQAAYPPIAAQLDIMYNQGFEGWFKHMRSIKIKYPSPYKDKEPELGNPMEELEKKVSAVETKTETEIQRMKQEMADLQAAIIDTKGAIYAIKGFMMEIPNIQKALTELSDVVKSK